MRFTTIETMCDPSFMLPLARVAEEAGFDGFAVPDSICYPEASDSTYPYNADGSREFLDDKPILEPFSLIPAMAAVRASRSSWIAKRRSTTTSAISWWCWGATGRFSARRGAWARISGPR